MSGGISAIVRRMRDEVHGGNSMRILVLGDPHATTCRDLMVDGHDVWCCPDLQRSDGAFHKRLAATTVDQLTQTTTTWDLVVAVEGFRRLQRVHSRDSLRDILGWIATASHSIVLEAPRDPLSPDLHDLGPYLLTDLLASFLAVTEIQSSDSDHSPSRPLLLASNAGLFVKDTWIPATELTQMPSTRAQNQTAVRTFELDETVIKVELGNEGYFEQCDAMAEGVFLLQSPENVRDALELPRVIDLQRGRAVNILVRERVAGAPLQPGGCGGGAVPIAAVIDAAARFSRLALFHNDFRPWNLLWTGRDVVAIDYANVCDADLDVHGIPQVLAFAGTIAALIGTTLPWGEAFTSALTETVDRSRIGERWSEEDLIGTGRSPWLAVDAARGGLTGRLSSTVDWTDFAIVESVVEEIMTAHEHEVGR